MISEVQLDDAEIEAHLLAGTMNLDNSNRISSSKLNNHLLQS